jgi:hypothetical protein
MNLGRCASCIGHRTGVSACSKPIAFSHATTRDYPGQADPAAAEGEDDCGGLYTLVSCR